MKISAYNLIKTTIFTENEQCKSSLKTDNRSNLNIYLNNLLEKARLLICTNIIRTPRRLCIIYIVLVTAPIAQYVPRDIMPAKRLAEPNSRNEKEISRQS